jgi:hypothetical protein
VTVSLSDCALFIEGLEQRPNVPPVSEPAPGQRTFHAATNRMGSPSGEDLRFRTF